MIHFWWNIQNKLIQNAVEAQIAQSIAIWLWGKWYMITSAIRKMRLEIFDLTKQAAR